MKKIVLGVAALAVIVMSFSSCMDKERCWRIEYKGQVVGTEILDREKVMAVEYFWGTMDEEDAHSSQVMMDYGFAGTSASTGTGLMTREDCEAKNE